MSFASLKKASSTGNTLSKLTREIEKLNQPAQGSGADERLWNCLLYTSPSPRDRG